MHGRGGEWGGGQKVGHLVCSCNGQRSLKIGEKIITVGWRGLKVEEPGQGRARKMPNN